MRKQIDKIKNFGEFLNEDVNGDNLINKLLSFGGKSVKLGLDTDTEISRILNDGILLDNSRVINVEGEPNQCHRNSAYRYKNYTKGFGNATSEIMSGYALYNNKWVQHSWLLTEFNYLEETTNINFKKYFGYKLTKEESDIFCYEND